jgi:hypothetical protein
MKTIKGLRSAMAELKTAYANHNFARVYYNPTIGELRAYEFASSSGYMAFSDNDYREILKYDSRAGKPTSKMIKENIADYEYLRSIYCNKI